ncbi:MAG TPA: hypothetical protein VMR50_21625 [Myxococcota bacterium]|nr:hypothetical protein [Myxococcota bacterium]
MAALALVTGITLLAGPASAGGDPNDPTKMCVNDARTTRKSCTQQCNDTFLASIDSCRNVDHTCADTARQSRETCVSDVLTALQQCVDQSCSGFDTLIQQCKTDNANDPELRDKCIDGVQVQRFECRDQCRENVQLFNSLKACRDEFKSDIAKCKLPPPMPKPMG